MNFKYNVGTRSFGDEKFAINLSIGDAHAVSPMVMAEEIGDWYTDYVMYTETEHCGAPLDWAFRYHWPSLTNSLRTTLSNNYRKYICAKDNLTLISAYNNNPAIKLVDIISFASEDEHVLIITDTVQNEYYHKGVYTEYRAYPIYKGKLASAVIIASSLEKVKNAVTVLDYNIFVDAFENYPAPRFTTLDPKGGE